jgi:hypothetical protein
VLVIVEGEERLAEALGAIRKAIEGLAEPELLVCRFLHSGASQLLETHIN